MSITVLVLGLVLVAAVVGGAAFVFTPKREAPPAPLPPPPFDPSSDHGCGGPDVDD